MTVGKERMDTSFGRFIAPHMQRHLTRILQAKRYIKLIAVDFSDSSLANDDPMDEKVGRLHNRNISDLAIKLGKWVVK